MITEPIIEATLEEVDLQESESKMLGNILVLEAKCDTHHFLLG